MQEELHCDECTKKSCEQRLAGALCSNNKKMTGLIEMFHSRDPLLVSRKLIEILDNEIKRYSKAVESEDIGSEEEIVITTAKGATIEKTQKKGIDNKISNLALNILKGGKLINEIINPKQATNPLFQQNNQYNFNLGMAEFMRSLPENEKGEVLKFIDEKLDAGR
ncbi:MAG: hypothetical protein PHN56_07180 [Candidatus Nanoarchaeia archaeon]|nr:hypothetical protein [Candidatus Nanoarchaeia archaeon]